LNQSEIADAIEKFSKEIFKIEETGIIVEILEFRSDKGLIEVVETGPYNSLLDNKIDQL